MKERKLYIQILSVFSCFSVVVLHVNGCFWTFSYERYWITANIMESIFYFAVPIFFMISGATLIDYRKRYSTKNFLKKRIMKTVVPFIIWSIIGVIWYHYIGGEEIVGLKNVIEGIINAEYINIYWFFPSLFSVYLAIPFLTYIPEAVRKKIYGYVIIVAFAVNSLLPFVLQLLKFHYNVGLSMPVAGGYILFLLIGYWLNTYELKRKYRYIIYTFALVGLMVHILGTWYFSYRDGAINQTFKGYNNVPCILYSTGIFLFIKNLKKETVLNLLNKITNPFSKVTFGIYLIHWFVLQLIYKFTDISTLSIWYRTFGSMLIFLTRYLRVGIVQTATFRGQQGRISRPVKAILSGRL